MRGTPLAVLALVRALGELGHRVDLLTFPQGDAGPAVPGLVHRRSLPLPVGRVRPGASLAKLLLDLPFMTEAFWRMVMGRYDVVHAVEEAAFFAAPLAALLGLPLVADVDSAIPEQLRESGFAAGGVLPWIAERLERRALGRAVGAITVCDALTARVRARAPGTPVFQIEDPPLVDDGAPPDPEAVERLRAALDVAGRPVVLYSGNFEPYQGVELLLDAVVHSPEVHVVLMGGDADAVVRLRARALDRGLARRAVFTGARPPAELPAFLALADVLASPRLRGQNTPFKVYTYMASGKPIVATRLPTHTQVLDDASAFLSEPTPEAFGAALTEALARPVEARARAARARDRVRRDYSRERYVQKVRAAYEAIAARAAAIPS